MPLAISAKQLSTFAPSTQSAKIRLCYCYSTFSSADKPRSIAMQTRACYLFLSLIMSLLLRNGAAFYEVSQKSTSADTTDLFLQRLHVGTIEKTASGSRLTSHSSVVSFRITDPQTDRSFIFKLSESQQQTLPHDSTSDWKIEVSVPRLPKPDAQSFWSANNPLRHDPSYSS